MKTINHLLIRLLITAIPLIGLYFWAEMAFRANREKEHPTDVGMGVALMLIFVLSALFFGFITDFITRLVKKDYRVALTDVPFLLAFIVPILYLSCLWSDGDGFCKCLTTTMDKI
ncbi:hypothetical protein [Chryseobacterium indologenes]|uniref:Uncharacterized protein n=1 Tax=Chryseobacterium indologenes TaxID=253 RepID=A0A0N0ZUE0_CHRID|nr:hypothetical protein [Chryseobacterium indologenes]KPE51038.1 hypothetical protein AOB46_11900 [Chryseobacterium indologenes]